jgi:hypothetical protein
MAQIPLPGSTANTCLAHATDNHAQLKAWSAQTSAASCSLHVSATALSTGLLRIRHTCPSPSPSRLWEHLSLHPHAVMDLPLQTHRPPSSWTPAPCAICPLLPSACLIVKICTWQPMRMPQRLTLFCHCVLTGPARITPSPCSSSPSFTSGYQRPSFAAKQASK